MWEASRCHDQKLHIWQNFTEGYCILQISGGELRSETHVMLLGHSYTGRSLTPDFRHKAIVQEKLCNTAWSIKIWKLLINMILTKREIRQHGSALFSIWSRQPPEKSKGRPVITQWWKAKNTPLTLPGTPTKDNYSYSLSTRAKVISLDQSLSTGSV